MDAKQLAETALTVTQEYIPEHNINEDFWRPKLVELIHQAQAHLNADELTTQVWLDSPVETPTRTMTLLQMAQIFGLLEEWDKGALWKCLSETE